MTKDSVKNLIARSIPPLSGGTAAKILRLLNELAEIESNPPAGKKKITNIFWDQDTQEIVIKHE
jgi:hypothetical protein